MDDYTSETRKWLEHRFRLVDGDGVFHAHQPIYGFRTGPHDRGPLPRYIRTQRVLDLLATLAFDSLLDVGGAEGFVTWMAQEHLNAHVFHSDLSVAACEKARAIFGLVTVPADIHALPFDNHAFDLVLCMESLEHVTDVGAAVREILRVGRLGAVITVPHEDPDRRVHEGKHHEHIHNFDLQSFDYLRNEGFHVESSPMVHPWARRLGALADARPRPLTAYSGVKRAAVRAFNRTTPILARMTGPRLAAKIIQSDAGWCRSGRRFESISFAILRPEAEWTSRVGPSADEILRTSVPLYRPEGSGT